MPFDELQIALPTITSHETLMVREWIDTDEQRRAAWSRKAHGLFTKVGMDKATKYLSALLCDEVIAELGLTEGLEQTLMELAVRRVNFFEIAIGLLKPYDNAGHFAPAPVECGDADTTTSGASAYEVDWLEAEAA